MKTVGEILKQARTDQGISLATVAAKTKIQIKYIRAVEENEFDKLPAAAFVRGFIRGYSRVVGKDPESLLAIFRRDYDQNEQGQIIPRGLGGMEKKRWQWTPTLTGITAGVMAVTIFAGYVLFQVRILSRPPVLVIRAPVEGAQVEHNMAVTGKSDLDAAVTVNSKPVVINDQGEFSEVILLSSGEHTITVKATARNGKSKTIQRTVMVE